MVQFAHSARTQSAVQAGVGQCRSPFLGGCGTPQRRKQVATGPVAGTARDLGGPCRLTGIRKIRVEPKTLAGAGRRCQRGISGQQVVSVTTEPGWQPHFFRVGKVCLEKGGQFIAGSILVGPVLLVEQIEVYCTTLGSREGRDVFSSSCGEGFRRRAELRLRVPRSLDGPLGDSRKAGYDQRVRCSGEDEPCREHGVIEMG